MASEIRSQARKFVFAALKTNTPTDEELREAVENVLPLVSKLNGVELDADEVVRTMQAEFNTFQAESVSLGNADGHLEWLPDRRDSIEWGFWERYLRYLQEEVHLPPRVLQRLDSTTQRILGKLEDPNRPGPWDRRGMVVGQIQSGKTGNYTGLICRAVDAGYRLVSRTSWHAQQPEKSDPAPSWTKAFSVSIRSSGRSPNADDGFTAAALGVGRLIGEASHFRPRRLTTSAEVGRFWQSQGEIVLASFRAITSRSACSQEEQHNSKESPGMVTECLGTSEIHKRVTETFPFSSLTTKRTTLRSTLKHRTDEPDKGQSKQSGDCSLVLTDAAYVGYTATPYANIYINPCI